MDYLGTCWYHVAGRSQSEKREEGIGDPNDPAVFSYVVSLSFFFWLGEGVAGRDMGAERPFFCLLSIFIFYFLGFFYFRKQADF